MKKSMCISAFLCLLSVTVCCQNTSFYKNRLVFSAIKGTISKPDTIAASANISSFTASDTINFKIASYKRNQLIIHFVPSHSFVGITSASLQGWNASGKQLIKTKLVGISTKGLEGENEPTLSSIVSALGYKINIGWTTLANHALPEMQGDEISASLFHKAGKGNVEIIPVARYSPNFELPFGYYIDSAAIPLKKEVGILAAAGPYPEHQCLFPATAMGNRSFDPGVQNFGFYVTGPTHSAFSEDVWNMFLYPSNAVHATRIYPLKDANGKSIANNYLLCFEEAKNGDYNDYVFIVKNIQPVTNDFFIPLLNGQNLNGWHSFIKGFGKNTEPDSNFIIKNNVLHVKGEQLGYVITDKSYGNYHFKIDFKWGARKWPPREDAKRDAGICYNIPVNEPDSIWPTSIECQIQEGDVGDFWLLGFSTIQSLGQQAKPSAHTRMIKQKDAEKPTGEWNTVEIISYNGSCIHIVNGVIVNEGSQASVKEGRILLQSEYAEIYYRNPRIRIL